MRAVRGAACGRPALLRELRRPSQSSLGPGRAVFQRSECRAGANRKGPKHLRIPATLLAVIVLASAAAGFEIGSSSGGTTTTSTTSTKSAVTSTAKTNSSTGTSTSSATGKNYSKQENKDNSVVSEP